MRKKITVFVAGAAIALAIGTTVRADPAATETATEIVTEETEIEESGENAPQQNSIYCDSINNTNDAIDHKHSKDSLLSLWNFYGIKDSGKTDIYEKIPLPEGKRILNDINYNQGTVTTGEGYLIAAKSYLIENEILDRPSIITVNKQTGVSAQRLEKNWLMDNCRVRKSDLYIMLYKAVFGTIESRILDYPSLYAKTTGDEIHHYYTSASVYELYLQALMEKGLVLHSELDSDNVFTTSWDERGVWHPSNGVFGLTLKDNGNDTSWLPYDGALGASFTTVFNNDILTITPTTPNYFEDETMNNLEALQIVEKFMRLTEKNMTEMEAKIIAYKYGVTYLKGLGDDEYATVAFLIAKGVINFEDDMLGFFEDSVWEKIYPIVYRVANKDARYDFSVIQLTDNEAFWQEKGFGFDEFELLMSNGKDVCVGTLSAEPEQGQGLEVISDSLCSILPFCNIKATAASGIKSYVVTKYFDQSNKYFYKGQNIKSIWDGTADPMPAEFDDNLDQQYVTINGVECYQMQFKINATSSKRAIQIVDDNITAIITDVDSYKVTAVTRLEEDGRETRMIPQSVIRKCFGSLIDVVDDKVLMSVKTGAMACLLPDTGYALVGNEVIVSDSLLVTDTSGDIFYNFDVIASLLGLSVTQLYNNCTNDYQVATALTPYNVNLFDSGNDSGRIGSLEYIIASSTTKGDEEILEFGKDASKIDSPAYLYNINQLANGISTIYRKFYVQFDEKDEPKPVVVLVDWTYIVPNVTEGDSVSLMDSDSTLTWQEVFNKLYTRPAGVLGDWWDSNLGMSQALSNMIFGTSRVEYVKCGYMVPSLTVLLPAGISEDDTKSKAVAEMFRKQFGFSIDKNYSKYVGGSYSNFLNKYYKDLSSISNRTLVESAKKYRNFQIITGKEQSKYKGISYGSDFFLSDSQVLYRSLEDDYGRLSYTVDGSENRKNQLSNVTIRSTVKKEYEAVEDGRDVTYTTGNGTTTYYYAGIKSFEWNGKEYQFLDLIPKPTDTSGSFAPFPAFKVNLGEDINTAMFKGTGTWQDYVIDNYYKTFGYTKSTLKKKTWYKLFFDNTNASLETIFRLNSDIKSVVLNSEKLNNKELYGLSTDKSGLNAYKLYRNNKWAESGNGGNCTGIPHIYLPTNTFYVYSDSDGDAKIQTNITSYLLNNVNLYYSGIVDGVIDAILAQHLKTTEIKNLKNKTKLIIGNTTWVKDGNWWYSYPVKNKSIAEKAKESGAAKKAFNEYFSGYYVMCDGIGAAFTNYAESVQLGTQYMEKIPVSKSCVFKNDKGETKILKKTTDGTSIKSSKANANYTVFMVRFDNSLLVRPITSDGSVYIMCNSASERVISGTDYPFYTEELNYDDDGAVSFTLSQSGFEQSSAFVSMKSDFYETYQEQQVADLKTLIVMWIVGISSYMLIMSWVAYLGVTKGTLLSLLEPLAGKVQNGKRTGIDFIRMLTFGVYNLDTPPVFNRIFVVTVVCLVIDTVCLKII